MEGFINNPFAFINEPQPRMSACAFGLDTWVPPGPPSPAPGMGLPLAGAAAEQGGGEGLTGDL